MLILYRFYTLAMFPGHIFFYFCASTEMIILHHDLDESSQTCHSSYPSACGHWELKPTSVLTLHRATPEPFRIYLPSTQFLNGSHTNNKQFPLHWGPVLHDLIKNTTSGLASVTVLLMAFKVFHYVTICLIPCWRKPKYSLKWAYSKVHVGK